VVNEPAGPLAKFGVVGFGLWCYAASPVVWERVSSAVWYAWEAARRGGEVVWSARCAKPVGRNRSCTAERNVAVCRPWSVMV
jgi:hypothetical protein